MISKVFLLMKQIRLIRKKEIATVIFFPKNKTLIVYITSITKTRIFTFFYRS